MKFLFPGVTEYLSRSVTPWAASSVSSIWKLPVALLGPVRISQAASARISGVRHYLRSTPGIFCIAAVALPVRGHRLLTPMPNFLNSPAWPSVHMLMPYFAML